jgi:hypothetical protein
MIYFERPWWSVFGIYTALLVFAAFLILRAFFNGGTFVKARAAEMGILGREAEEGLQVPMFVVYLLIPVWLFFALKFALDYANSPHIVHARLLRAVDHQVAWTSRERHGRHGPTTTRRGITPGAALVFDRIPFVFLEREAPSHYQHLANRCHRLEYFGRGKHAELMRAMVVDDQQCRSARY